MDMANTILSFDLNKVPREFSPRPHTLFDIHFNIIVISMPLSSYMFPYLLPTKNFPSTPFMPQASPIPSLILQPQYLVNSINNKSSLLRSFLQYHVISSLTSPNVLFSPPIAFKQQSSHIHIQNNMQI
jgi:hypothetical protein